MIDAVIIGLTLGCVYASIAIGYSLIYRTTGVISFAQGAFVMLGAIFAAYLRDEHGMGTLPAAGLGVVGAAASGALLFVVIILPLWKRQAEGITTILGTVLFLVIAQNLVLNFIGSEPRSLPPMIDGGFRVGDTYVLYQVVILFVATMLLALGLNMYIVRSRTGRAMRACANDRRVSAQLGIRVSLIALGVFTLSAAFGAISGMLVVPLQFVSYSSAMSFNLRGFAAAILGGISDIRTALFGGLALGVLESMIATYVSSSYLDALLLISLLFVLLVKPNGAFSRSAVA